MLRLVSSSIFSSFQRTGPASALQILQSSVATYLQREKCGLLLRLTLAVGVHFIPGGVVPLFGFGGVTTPYLTNFPGEVLSPCVPQGFNVFSLTKSSPALAC